MKELPKYIFEFLQRLSSAGFESYLAGGCVRDMAMGLRPSDYDVATPATPDAVKRVFKACHDTGLKHGTVTVKYRGRLIEVTTFRSEGPYGDHRRPESVTFEKELTNDLSRRDFTINAMALSKEGSLTDPFGGLDDLKKRIIRCVGSPEKRFEEDALRMFRAIRFSARLGFEIEPETLAAIKKMAGLSKHLSAERVRDELVKTLLSPRPEAASKMAELGLLEGYIPKAPLVRLPGLAKLPKKPEIRLAGFLFHGGISPEPFMGSLKFDNRTRALVSAAIALAQSMPEDDFSIKTALYKYGKEALSLAATLSPRRKATALKRVLASGECLGLDELAIKGRDLTDLGIGPGRETGETLERLLTHVFRYPEDNDREILLKLIEKAPPLE